MSDIIPLAGQNILPAWSWPVFVVPDWGSILCPSQPSGRVDQGLDQAPTFQWGPETLSRGWEGSQQGQAGGVQDPTRHPSQQMWERQCSFRWNPLWLAQWICSRDIFEISHLFFWLSLQDYLSFFIHEVHIYNDHFNILFSNCVTPGQISPLCKNILSR